MPPPVRFLVLTMPAFNEAAAIGELLDQARDALKATGLEWAVVVVDDGSSDDTAAIVERAAAAEPRIRLERHPRNLGLGPAILTGLRAALRVRAGEDALVVCMDADLTHSPTVVPRMIEAADAGADLVIASRFQPGSEQVGVNAFRRLLSWGARRLFAATLALPGVRDYTCGFRAIRASLIEAGFERFGDRLIERKGFACTDELLVKLAMLGPTIRETPFVLRYDWKRGKSKIKLWTTIVETLKLANWARAERRRKD